MSYASITAVSIGSSRTIRQRVPPGARGMSNRVVGLVSAILCVILGIRTASALVGRLDPCATPGSITKVHVYACLLLHA